MPDTWKRGCRQVWLSSWSMRGPDCCLRQIVAPLSSLVCCNPPRSPRTPAAAALIGALGTGDLHRPLPNP